MNRRINTKKQLGYVTIRAVCAVTMLAVGATTTLVSIDEANAVSQEAPVNVGVGSSISITVPAAFNLSATPTSSGPSGLVTVTDNIQVATNNPSGYTLTLSINNTMTSNALINTINPSYTVPSIESTSGSSAFPVNHWGFSLDQGSIFQPLPTLGSQSEIKRTTEPTHPIDTTSFTVGTQIDMSTAAGLYENKLMFTAVSN